VCIPEIADYEVRRELLRSHKVQGISRLDALQAIAEYILINTDIMRKAAELWAITRNQGYPTADLKALDGDVILAATAIILSEQDGDEVIIATSNVRHIGRFTSAKVWKEITLIQPYRICLTYSLLQSINSTLLPIFSCA
jgi:predicted nucleic acid-binding protein